MALKDWPPVFTLLLPFFGWFFGELVATTKEAPLVGLLLGLCVGLAADLVVALWDWLSGAD